MDNQESLLQLESTLFECLEKIFDGDSAHDIGHIKRVLTNARNIANHLGDCDPFVLTASAILHDCVNVPKNSPMRKMASQLSANQGAEILARIDFNQLLIDRVKHAITAHSFSAAVKPESNEARALQDADRLDGLGAIGIARCFAVSGAMGRALFDSDDPLAERRELNEQVWALDHFQTKLLGLADTMCTDQGKKIAHERTKVLADFMQQILQETMVTFDPHMIGLKVR